MSPEEINIAIAEACGWIFIPSHDGCHGGIAEAVPGCWIDPDGEKHWEDNPIPDFYGDLNAMHEAEKTLDAVECQEYFDILDATFPFESIYPAITCCFHYSALERATAFCQAKKIGKWKES